MKLPRPSLAPLLLLAAAHTTSAFARISVERIDAEDSILAAIDLRSGDTFENEAELQAALEKAKAGLREWDDLSLSLDPLPSQNDSGEKRTLTIRGRYRKKNLVFFEDGVLFYGTKGFLDKPSAMGFLGVTLGGAMMLWSDKAFLSPEHASSLKLSLVGLPGKNERGEWSLRKGKAELGASLGRRLPVTGIWGDRNASLGGLRYQFLGKRKYSLETEGDLELHDPEHDRKGFHQHVLWNDWNLSKQVQLPSSAFFWKYGLAVEGGKTLGMRLSSATERSSPRSSDLVENWGLRASLRAGTPLLNVGTRVLFEALDRRVPQHGALSLMSSTRVRGKTDEHGSLGHQLLVLNCEARSLFLHELGFMSNDVLEIEPILFLDRGATSSRSSVSLPPFSKSENYYGIGMNARVFKGLAGATASFSASDTGSTAFWFKTVVSRW